MEDNRLGFYEFSLEGLNDRSTPEQNNYDQINTVG